MGGDASMGQKFFIIKESDLICQETSHRWKPGVDGRLVGLSPEGQTSSEDDELDITNENYSHQELSVCRWV